MKKILLSATLVLGMMTLTTGCSKHEMGAKKCGASGKCNHGKCGSQSKAKKCGTSGKCNQDKCSSTSTKKCGSK